MYALLHICNAFLPRFVLLCCTPQMHKRIFQQRKVMLNWCFPIRKICFDFFAILDVCMQYLWSFNTIFCWFLRHYLTNTSNKCGKSFNFVIITYLIFNLFFFSSSSELLEKRLNGSEPSFVSMLKNVYETCMDVGKKCKWFNNTVWMDK